MKSKRFLTGNTWIIRCLMAIGSNWLHKTAYVENSSGRFMRNITSEETCTSPQRPSVYIKSYRNCFCLWSNVLWRQEHKNAPAAFSWYKFWHWNHPHLFTHLWKKTSFWWLHSESLHSKIPKSNLKLNVAIPFKSVH